MNILSGKTPYYYGLGLLAAVPVCALVLPNLLTPLFTGPDGIIWVMPFIVWMGILAAGWCFAVPLLRKKSYDTGFILLTGIALFFIGMFLFVALQRFSSGLRGLEAFQDFMGYRISIGNDIFPNPEAAVLGNHYTPLFFFFTSLLYRLFPGYYGYGRLVSIGASLVSAVMIYRIIKQEGKTDTQALWGTVLFLSTYSIMGKMYDWAQNDPLQTCFISVSLFQFLKKTPRGDMWALFFGGCACFTKQTGILAFAVILVFSLASKRRMGYYWPLVFWAGVAAVLLLVTEGRAWTYLASNPGHNEFLSVPHPEVLFRFFVLLSPIWIAALLDRAFLQSRRFTIFAAAQLAASLLGVWKTGGWINNLFPFIPILCIAALGESRKLRWLWMLQIVMGLYNPFSTLYPWKTIRDTDRRMVEMARAVSGEVWFPVQPYLAPSSGHAFWDDIGVMEAHCWAKRPAPRRLITAIQERRFSLILLRKEGDFWFPGACREVEESLTGRYIRKEKKGLVAYWPLVSGNLVDAE